jgi:hypothetical protein
MQQACAAIRVSIVGPARADTVLPASPLRKGALDNPHRRGSTSKPLVPGERFTTSIVHLP